MALYRGGVYFYTHMKKVFHQLFHNFPSNVTMSTEILELKRGWRNKVNSFFYEFSFCISLFAFIKTITLFVYVCLCVLHHFTKKNINKSKKLPKKVLYLLAETEFSSLSLI